MPIDYVIDKERMVVVATGEGALTNDEAVDFIRRLRSDSEMIQGIPSLIDVRRVSSMDVNLEGLSHAARISAETNEQRGDIRVAIMVRNEGDESIAKLFRALSDLAGVSQEIKTFRILPEAEAWLGLNEN